MGVTLLPVDFVALVVVVVVVQQITILLSREEVRGILTRIETIFVADVFVCRNKTQTYLANYFIYI